VKHACYGGGLLFFEFSVVVFNFLFDFILTFYSILSNVEKYHLVIEKSLFILDAVLLLLLNFIHPGSLAKLYFTYHVLCVHSVCSVTRYPCNKTFSFDPLLRHDSKCGEIVEEHLPNWLLRWFVTSGFYIIFVWKRLLGGSWKPGMQQHPAEILRRHLQTPQRQLNLSTVLWKLCPKKQWICR